MVRKSPFKQMGYLMVDHRASPGLSEDVARQVGYDPKLVGEGKVYEADTLSCAHCRGSVVKNPFRTRAREHCSKCDAYICDGCGYLAAQPDYVHTPFAKIIEDHINQAVLGSPSDLLFPKPKEN